MGDIGRAAQAGASIADAAIGADAARYGADQVKAAADNSLAFNKSVYSDTKSNQAPFVAAGQTAINNLSTETQPGGSLNQQWTKPFSFTQADLPNDPAYNFDLQQGRETIQRSAASQGGLVSGGAMKDLDKYSQGLASNQFQQSYQNALGQYQQAYQIFNDNQTNSFNREASVAGIGQTGTNSLAASGTNAAANYANIAQTGAAGQAAAGMGVANSLQNGINGVANSLAMNSNSSYGPATTSVVNDQWGNSLPGAPAYNG